ncbi:hypothetical protein QTH87_09310 [Variovorax sp. J22P168]|uniref:hypothetical protein n=1 Tax=Variovorax jilinensis TaxID=3053513 RepID=UPI002576E18E|nr:hypothetical protein [Variovorax sp. J22P168]MDM0012625.1 hypothetical protein [Variovorax sp. J22P168]
MNSAVASSLPAAPPVARRASMTRAGRAFIGVLLVLVFEGAVRKWGSASATIPLLLLRDVLAIYVIAYAFTHGHLQRQRGVTMVLLVWSCMVVAWGLFQLVAGQSSPIILLIGLRFWLLYIWFAVAAAAAMNETDYRVAVLTAVWILVIMVPLALVQSVSPPGARINSQVGGEEDEIFLVAAGVVRTTGFFSFTLGYTTYLALVAPLVFGVLAARKRNPLQSLFAVLALAGLVAGSLVSGSRATIVYAIVFLPAYFLGRLWFARGPARTRAALAVFGGVILIGVLLFVFSGAIEIASQRFETAAESEDFWVRLLTIFIGEPYVHDRVDWLGLGLGLGSNLASYVRIGSQEFALAEFEAGRILLEGGLLGYAYTALKVGVIAVGVSKSLILSYRVRSPYPVLLWLAVSLALLTWSSIGQLSAHGMLGILLAMGLLVFKYPQAEFFPARASARS